MKTVSASLAALGLLAGLAVLPAAPALAQNQRIIEVYGSDPCPSSGGEEIVVCRRLPEKDRYRIPERLRRSEPERGVAANRGTALAESTRAASADQMPNSCSPVGSNGQSGCNRALMRQAREERRQMKEEVPVIED